MRTKQRKNGCKFCGRPVNTQGWCGSPDHDEGNPFSSGIACLTPFITRSGLTDDVVRDLNEDVPPDLWRTEEQKEKA